MENNIIPFGKYKGQPIEVMANDKQYLEWVQQQGWLAEKYPQINTLIINNFQTPSETPDHNKIQGLFLNDDFCFKLGKKFLSIKKSHVLDKIISDYNGCGVVFELNGIDVCVYYSDSKNKQSLIRVEIKTSIGDDYPAVLRQIRSLKGYSPSSDNLLLINEYNGIGLSETDFIKLFNSQGIVILYVKDIINMEVSNG